MQTENSKSFYENSKVIATYFCSFGRGVGLLTVGPTDFFSSLLPLVFFTAFPELSLIETIETVIQA